ncbi:hypothetical protein VSU19_12335 [Verrucomicrobiales bacterium BCK34]|nr:hypothetical protein [Verrucomicrobiales bacterium BCK34]
MRDFLEDHLQLQLNKNEEVFYAQDNGHIVFLGREQNHKKLEVVSNKDEKQHSTTRLPKLNDGNDTGFEF